MKSFSNDKIDFLPNNKAFLLLLCLSLALILGILVRIPYFFIYDFALNDGALFVQMSEAIKTNGYILPETVVYNRTDLPFAYPPLSFYAVAVLTELFNFNVLDVVRYMPLVFNILSIGVFVILASQLLKDKVILLYTSLFFPLTPRSYEWLIMGGGVTRSVGCFFALMAIYQANRLLLKYNIRTFIYCSLLLSMSVLSHLEWGITSIVAVALLILFKQINRRGFVLIIALGTMVVIMTSPWWITVFIRHGLVPFLAASKTSEWTPITFASIGSAALRIFDDQLGGIPLSGLAIIGWLLSVARKDWFFPVWLVAIFLTTPRHGPTAATIPLAILAAVGLAQLLIPMTKASAFIKNKINAKSVPAELTRSNKFSHQLLTKYIIASSIVVVVCILIMTNFNYAKHTPLIALTRSERSAMTWLKDNTPSEAEFIVLTTSFSWQDDRVAEWFPVLSDRKSLTTAQGLEWLPGDVFRSTVESIKELKHNQAVDGNGLAKYIESHYDFFRYVAVFIPHVNTSYGKFIGSGYQTVYSNDSVLVLERK